MNKRKAVTTVLAVVISLAASHAAAQRDVVMDLGEQGWRHYQAIDREDCYAAGPDTYINALKYLFAYQQMWRNTMQMNPDEERRVNKIVASAEQYAAHCLEVNQPVFSSAGMRCGEGGCGGGGPLSGPEKEDDLVWASSNQSLNLAQQSHRTLELESQVSQLNNLVQTLSNAQRAGLPAGIWMIRENSPNTSRDMARLVLIPESNNQYRALLLGDQPDEQYPFGLPSYPRPGWMAYYAVIDGEEIWLEISVSVHDISLQGAVTSGGERKLIIGYPYGDARLHSRPNTPIDFN